MSIEAFHLNNFEKYIFSIAWCPYILRSCNNNSLLIPYLHYKGNCIFCKPVFNIKVNGIKDTQYFTAETQYSLQTKLVKYKKSKMSDPTIQTFCCHHTGSKEDLAIRIMDEFNTESYNIVCLVSSTIGILGSIYQVILIVTLYVYFLWHKSNFINMYFRFFHVKHPVI